MWFSVPVVECCVNQESNSIEYDHKGENIESRGEAGGLVNEGHGQRDNQCTDPIHDHQQDRGFTVDLLRMLRVLPFPVLNYVGLDEAGHKSLPHPCNAHSCCHEIQLVGQPHESRRTSQKGADCEEEVACQDKEDLVESVGDEEHEHRDDHDEEREVEEEDSDSLLVQPEVLRKLEGENGVDGEVERDAGHKRQIPEQHSLSLAHPSYRDFENSPVAEH